MTDNSSGRASMKANGDHVRKARLNPKKGKKRHKPHEKHQLAKHALKGQ